MDLQSLREKCEEVRQGQLLQFWDQLNEQQQEDLANQIRKIDLQAVSKYCADAKHFLERMMTKQIDNLEPPEPEMIECVEDCSKETIDKYRHLGLAAIGNNEVALILMAGGQGSRLGCTCPKGIFDVGLPSGKTLYQLQAEKIVKLQWMATAVTGKPCCIPWYIMTSAATRRETVSFLRQNNYFGLKKENVIIFDQGMLPCFDENGAILMEFPHKIAMSPAGNGDLYRALREEGALDDLVARGVQHVHVYNVENILLRMADPVFIGYCISKNLDLGAKAIEKKLPEEALSVAGKANGVFKCLHYHELKDEIAQRRTPDGKLLFHVGILGDVIYSMDFLQHLCLPEIESQLQHHVAHKAIPFIDSHGHQQRPTSPNGIKLEKFLFDDFDFPHQSRLHDAADESIIACEISPLVSYAGEGLEEIVKGETFVPPLVIDLSSDHKSVIIKQGKDLPSLSPSAAKEQPL